MVTCSVGTQNVQHAEAAFLAHDDHGSRVFDVDADREVLDIVLVLHIINAIAFRLVSARSVLVFVRASCDCLGVTSCGATSGP